MQGIFNSGRTDVCIEIVCDGGSGQGGDADCATEVKVSSQSYDDTKIFKGVFATQSDGSCTTVSASDPVLQYQQVMISL